MLERDLLASGIVKRYDESFPQLGWGATSLAALGPNAPRTTGSILTGSRQMNYCVIVQTRGKELDQLRGVAYRVSRDAKTDWFAEARDSGTAFCFENADVRTRFCAICTNENITFATETLGH